MASSTRNKSVRLLLPSTLELSRSEQAWVDLEPKINDWLEFIEQDYLTTAELTFVTKAITQWNLTDEKDIKLLINEDTVGLLPVIDFKAILEALMAPKEALTLRQHKDLVLHLVAKAKNENSSVVPPVSYTLYEYRKQFGLSWPEFCATPLEVVLRDIEFMRLEKQVGLET